MATIAKGNTLEKYFDNDTTITITPASGGSVRFGCSSPVGATRPADRVIYSATSIAIPGGSTVFAQAVGGDADYQTALGDASKGAIVSSGLGGLPSIYCFGSSSTERNQDGASKLCYGYVTRFLRKCGGGVRYLGSSGVGGEDSVSQVARLPAVIAGLSEKPRFFVLQVAGNDVVSATPLADVLANITTMFNAVSAAGMTPVLYTPPPKSSYSAAEIIRFGAIIEHMRWLHRTHANSRLADVARWTISTTSTTYGVIAGLQDVDNLHLNARGTENAANALYEALYNDVVGRKYYAATPVVSQYDATSNPYGSLVANPFLTGTTGTGGAWVTAGSVPTGISLTRVSGSGTVAISKVARTDRPGEWTRLTFTMQSGDSYAITSRPSVSMSTQPLYGVAETRVDRSLTNGNVSVLAFRLRNNPATVTIWDGQPAGDPADNYEPVTALADEWYETVPYAFPAANPFNIGYWTAEVGFVGTGTFVLDIGCMDIRVSG